MDLISLRNIELGFGGDLLLEGLSLSVTTGERVCLLGRNGSGKTTLLKLVTGELAPDDGEIIRDPAIRIAGLPQSVPGDITGSARSVVTGGLGELERLLETHRRIVSGYGDRECFDALDVAHLGAGSAVTRRAHQSSRRGGHRMAGGAHRCLARGRSFHDP